MDKYLEAEKRLAELLGWRYKAPKRIGVFSGWLDPNDAAHSHPPQWCRDWTACGPLIVEYNLSPEFDNKHGCVSIEYHERAYNDYHGYYRVHEHYANHPTKDTAVRYAIVQAVIAKLEQER